ncbi:GNAT family N-acetyltransferase [Kitasatospora sp. NPDC057015]|uniref:GNAT family N-acetyltransferase n=1 Tax=Kitasatospora sp. NPDC057015 TaxID=3346001 RepID=UPI0036271F98
MRRRWRRGTEAGLALDALTGPAMLPALPAFAQLAVGTADRHGTRLYGADMLLQLAAVPGAVLLAARHQSELVGGIYGWLHEGRLSLWASGVDYEHDLARSVYTWLMTEAPRWAIDQGAHTIDAGRANYQAKARFGYRPHVLRTVIHLPGHQLVTANALTRLSKRLGEQALPYLAPGATW